MRNALILMIAVWAVAAAALGVSAQDVEAEAQKIEGMLMAPCCGANTVAEHHSPAADEMKREIRVMLAAGKSRQEILDHYVAKHGHLILSTPPARGFNLFAYLIPLLALVVGPLLLWWKLRRNRSASTEPPTEPTLPAVDPEYRERLERELRL